MAGDSANERLESPSDLSASATGGGYATATASVTRGRKSVERTATLARLTLSDAELDAAGIDLNRILHYVEMLGEVDTTGVEPMTHGVAWTSVFADDTTGDELPREAALANAPKHDGERYLVPAVLE